MYGKMWNYKPRYRPYPIHFHKKILYVLHYKRLIPYAYYNIAPPHTSIINYNLYSFIEVPDYFANRS